MKKLLIYIGIGLLLALAAWYLLTRNKAGKELPATTAINTADEAGFTELLDYIKSMPNSGTYTSWWVGNIAAYGPGGAKESYINQEIYKVGGRITKTGRLFAATNELMSVPEYNQRLSGNTIVANSVYDKYMQIRGRIATAALN